MSTETPAVAAADLRSTLATLVRREFWEHRALWLAPLVVAAVLAACTLFSVTIGIQVNDTRISAITPSERVMVLNMSQLTWMLVMSVVACIVGGFYALDCLYSERRDRSILFWKSLPVSDGLTVLSKFLAVSVGLPLLVLVLGSVSYLLALLIWKVRVATGAVPDVVAWGFIPWLRGEAVIVLCMLLAVLWYAPVVAAALLLSAYVRRNPLLWAALLLALLPIFEYIVFRTRFVLDFMQYRSGAIWWVLTHRDGHDAITPEGRMLNDLNWPAAFGSAALWLGVVAAALLLYATARVRRYRDDNA